MSVNMFDYVYLNRKPRGTVLGDRSLEPLINHRQRKYILYKIHGETILFLGKWSENRIHERYYMATKNQRPKIVIFDSSFERWTARVRWSCLVKMAGFDPERQHTHEHVF